MLEGEDIAPVLAKIREKWGIDFTQYRCGTLQRRIARRIAARGCVGLASYVSLLDTDPDEPRNLLHDLTIKYTEFFRDPWVFDTLRDEILPAIMARRRGRQINIWSAACATGEETYSLAALILQINSCAEQPVDARILGTDVDPTALDIARSGDYSKLLLPRVPEGDVARYFHDRGNTITVADGLRELVEFRVHDLANRASFSALREMEEEQFDLILCRNVLIYLQQEAQTGVLGVCHEALSPQGFLVLGTGEIVPEAMWSRLEPVNRQAKIYRKVS